MKRFIQKPTFPRLPEVGRNQFQYKQHLCQTTLISVKNPYSVSTERKPRTQPHKAQNKACNQLERKRMSNIPQTCESRLKHPKIGKLKALKFLVNSCRFSPLWHGTCINWNEPAMQKRIGVSHDNPIPNPTNYEQNLFFFYSFILLSSYSSRTDLINSRTILLAGFSLNFLIVSKDVVPK